MASRAPRSIDVQCARVGDGWSCAVKLDKDHGYGYVVDVSGQELERYGRGWADATELVTASFRFLLDHESPDSILAHFSISAIESYFPEFRSEIGRYLETMQ